MKKPLPGFGVAVVDQSQFGEVKYEGEDRWDTPQAGSLLTLTPEDKTKKIGESELTYGDLLGKKIFWKKYSDADGLFFDEVLNKEVIFLDLSKITGYELDEE